MILVTVALVTAAAIGLSLRQDSLYRASADVFLGSESLSADLTAQDSGSRDPERDVATQAQLARLPAVASRALEVANLPRRPQSLLNDSSVTTSGQADILTFSVTASEPGLASRLATAYAQAYTEYRRGIDTKALVTARKGVEQQLANLRGQGVRPDSSLFLILEKRRGELRTVEALRGSKALLVRRASTPTQIQPKPLRNAILGAFLGLLLGVVLVLLRDALNTRVRTVEEVAERLGLPLLARIPDLNRARRSASSDLIMLTDPRAVDAEVFRMLATNIDFANADRGARTIMITSAGRGEGKSTTLANLAAAFARRGERVLLADFDLRAPSIHSFFGIDARPGAADVALGQIALEEALVRVPLVDLTGRGDDSENGGATTQLSSPRGTLEVLPAGTLPSDASEFVASPSVKSLVNKLATRAELVLIDSPPMLQVSDGLLLSARVDSLLVVTRLSDVRRPILDELRRLLDTAPTVKLGFIVTGVRQTEPLTHRYGDAVGQGVAGPGRSRRGRDRVG